MYRTSFILFISILFFSPLAFGSVEQWSMTTVQFLICCCALFLVLSPKKDERYLLKVPGTLPLTLLIFWMLFQVLSLPPSIIHTVAPSTYEIYQPILDVSPQDQWIPLTVNQKATLFESMRIASYALFYFLTVQILSSGPYLKKTVRIVSYLAIGIAFLAIIQKFSSPNHIYWFRSTPEGAGTVGPWVYHNHYAGFMEMMCPLVLALFLFYQPTVNHEKPLRSRIAEICTLPGSNLHVFFGCGVLVIISSIFVSLSRGGIISLTMALLFFVLVLPRKTFNFKYVTYGFLVCSIALMVTWFGWGSIIEKFGTTFTDTGNITNIRLQLWQDSLNIIHDFFLTGTGFGTFIHIYPLYKTVANDAILDHAHNDYIELLTDGGIVGFVLAACFILTIILHAWKNLKIRRDRYAILVSIGALTGIVSILFHSVTDFNMHNGANGLYFFFLCGLLVSAGNTRLYYRTRPTLLDEAGSHSKIILIVVSVILMGMAVVIRGGAMLADTGFSQVANIYLNKKLHKEKILAVASTAKRSITYDPLEGKYSFALGNAQIFLEKPEDALASFLHASRKDPLSGIYLQKLALMLTTVDRNAAERLMQISYDRALIKAPLLLTWAEWLLALNERESAIQVLRTIFTSKPEYIKKFMPSLLAHSFTRREMTLILPKSASAWANYGSLLEKQGKIEEAEFYRSGALDFLDLEEVIKPRIFIQLYQFYYRQKNYDQAVITLRKAIEKLPEHARFHTLLGDYYRWHDIPYRAREEYNQALLLEPANEEARKGLKKLEEKK
jgi:O-antigen ligase/tetratricopeptide (TPR) repeat protein